MQSVKHFTIAILFFCATNYNPIAAQAPGEYFKMRIIDEETGRGVPMVEMKKIATHNKYNFYNVTQHPFFDKEDGHVWRDPSTTLILDFEAKPVLFDR